MPDIRPVEGASTAILFVHGIVGTPDHFRPLIPLVPAGWSVYNILLEGHGGTVADFAHASMAGWRAQVRTQLDQILSAHRHVVIAAHSMGTLFAIREAVDRPDRVSALFLMAVPLAIHLPPATMWAALCTALGKVRPGTSAAAMAADSSVTLTPNLLRYLPWLPRFAELLREARAVRTLLPRLTIPCRCFQSAQDELVSRRSRRYLTGHPCITLTTLPDSGHFSYSPSDLLRLKTEFQRICAEKN